MLSVIRNGGFRKCLTIKLSAYSLKTRGTISSYPQIGSHTLIMLLLLTLSDLTSFYGILVKHISKLLQERDEIRVDEKEWVIKEAMNPKRLQHGGTFCKVLSRKFDEIIVPIFKEIVAYIDQNFNLNLIDPKKEQSRLSRFWLSMFNNVVRFSYEDMLESKDHLNGVKTHIPMESYKCELPFSWLIHEVVKSQWDNARSISGKSQYLILYPS